MNILAFVNSLCLGGTEKAACRWAWGLKERGHVVCVLSLKDGPRRAELEAHGVTIQIVPEIAGSIASVIASICPDVIHAHAPGFPCEGDIYGEALLLLPKIPLVQTNIFGRLENPKEDAWTDFRLFISWTSCVQAARRAGIPLDHCFFRKASVAVYPLDPDDGPAPKEIADFRASHGIDSSEVVFGRLSRPEPNKWTDLPLTAFRQALKRNCNLKLLLREPPPLVTAALRAAADADRFCILPATSDPAELRLTMASFDVVLHTSNIGESFGYGIAEPMNLGKPVITNSVPWTDQAQLELVRHGEGGLHGSTPKTMSKAILALAADPELRTRMGEKARDHIRVMSDPNQSLDRLEDALKASIEGEPNPRIEEDLQHVKITADYLDVHQFGHGFLEQIALRPFYHRVRFHQWREAKKLAIRCALK